MLYLEKKISLDKREERLIEYVFSEGFPVCYQVGVGDMHYYGHILLGRSGRELPGVQGVIQSPYYHSFKKLFLRICQENDIKVKTIYRMAINSSFYHEGEHCGIHVDHRFPHKIMLLYLDDTKGDTYLYNSKLERIGQISPEKNKVIVFDDYHANGYPEPGTRRLIFITTFDEE